MPYYNLGHETHMKLTANIPAQNSCWPVLLLVIVIGHSLN